ncbi:MAG TPA: response regulator [Planctomycetota bacterium]|nr:response regulator [Planctomycetota bacterium]
MNILLIEDNPGDCELMQEALSEVAVPHRLEICQDGAAALARLRKRADGTPAPRPDLILLDLNMPRMDGREFLAARKADPDLLEIPVIVLTTSEADSDIRSSYRLHANAFVTKPFDFGDFTETARRIAGFWSEIAIVPTKA